MPLCFVLGIFHIFIIRFTETVSFSIPAGIQARNWSVRRKAEDCMVREWCWVKFIYLCFLQEKSKDQTFTIFGKVMNKDEAIGPTFSFSSNITCRECFRYIGHTMDVFSPFISVLYHSDWLFQGESCPRIDVVQSIQAVRGLPRLRAPGIVLCIISFFR